MCCVLKYEKFASEPNTKLSYPTAKHALQNSNKSMKIDQYFYLIVLSVGLWIAWES